MIDYELDVVDIEYKSGQLARLYRPRGDGPFPAAIEVHGGAWTINDRTANVALHSALAASGIVVMAIDFRMPPSVQYPEALVDINFAVRWLKANATKLGTKPEWVGGIGTSSGGHLMMLSAMRPKDMRYTAATDDGAIAAYDARVAFVVMGWPILDPLARYKMAKEKKMDKLVQAHVAFWPSEAAMDEGNPQTIVERGERTELPPVLIVQGTKDDNVTPDMADRFAVVYANAGGKVRLEKYPDQVHGFTARDPKSESSLAAFKVMSLFIHEFGSPK